MEGSMKFLNRGWLSLPVAILVALAVVTPAAAGDTEAIPDAQVRRAGGPQLGDNIFNLDGTNQTVGGHKARRYQVGAARWFYAYVYNDGIGSGQPFLVGATEPAPTVRPQTASSPFLVQYFTPSGVDITASVLTGTYVTDPVQVGERTAIRVKVTVTPGTPHGAQVHLLVTFTAQFYPSNKDTVGIKMWRK
jgi:hypothetical protein